MYIGLKFNRLRIIKRAGSNRRGILVLVKCDCGKQHVAVLSEVLSGHTTSCGCRKHQCYVDHTQRIVSSLSQDAIMQSFLYLAGDKDTARPDHLRWDVIRSAFYRRTEQLNSLPEGTTLAIKNCVLAGHDYNRIAAMTGRHRSEIAWLAKHVIRPEARREREQRYSALVAMKRYRMYRSAETEYLSELEKLPSYLDLRDHAERYLDRMRLQQLRDDRFSASELHNPDRDRKTRRISEACRIARLNPHSLDSAWHWVNTRSAGLVLSRCEQSLLDWFRDAVNQTLQYRKRTRKDHAERTRKIKEEQRMRLLRVL
jgi:hypothetical protein